MATLAPTPPTPAAAPAPGTRPAPAAGAAGRVTVVIADDHPLVRDSLARALAEDGRFAVVGEAADGHQAVALVERLAPDAAVLDVRMPGLDGIRAMAQIVEARPQTRVILLSAFDDEAVVRSALGQGAAGYVTKDADRQALCDAIARAAAGEPVTPLAAGRPHAQAPAPPELTLRERNVLLLVRDGWDERMIAFMLDVEPQDVGWYLDRVVAKLGAEDRADAVDAARAWGLTP